MTNEKKPSIYVDRGTIGSSDELDEYGVWVKSEPQDLSSAGLKVQETPQLTGEISGTDDSDLDFPEIDDLPDFDSLQPENYGTVSKDTVQDDGYELPEMDIEEKNNDETFGFGDFKEPPVSSDSTDDFIEIPDIEDSAGDLPELLEDEEGDEGFTEVSMNDFIGTGDSEPEEPDLVEDMQASAGFTERPQAVEHGSASDLSTQLLMKIAEELSSIRAELSSLKKEFSVVKASTHSEEGGEKDFFGEEDDEKIALTGDELNNILNTADFTEEAGSDATVDISTDLDLEEAEDDISSDPFLEGSEIVPEESTVEEPITEDFLTVDQIIPDESNDQDLNINLNIAEFEDLGGEVGAEDSGESISMDDLSMQDLSTESISEDDLSVQDLSTESISEDDLSVQDLSAESISMDDLSEQDLSIENISEDDLSVQDLSAESISMDDLSEQDLSIESISEEVSVAESSQDPDFGPEETDNFDVAMDDAFSFSEEAGDDVSEVLELESSGADSDEELLPDFAEDETDELRQIREDGAQPMTFAPEAEDSDYLAHDPLASEPLEEEQLAEESLAQEPLVELPLDENVLGTDDYITADLESEELDEPIDFSEAVIDEPDLSSDIQDNPLEEPSLEDISIHLDLSDLGSMEPVSEEEALTDETGELEIESGEDLSLIPEGFAAETDDLAAPIEEMEETIANDDLGFLETSGNDADEPAEIEEEPDLESNVVGVKSGANIPNNLQRELKVILSYLDQLLESLPDEKIEEFAKSDYYDTYKKLFKDLGLV